MKMLLEKKPTKKKNNKLLKVKTINLPQVVPGHLQITRKTKPGFVADVKPISAQTTASFFVAVYFFSISRFT